MPRRRLRHALPARLATALVILAIVSIFGSSTARAQEDTDARRGDVRIIEVSGLLDAVTADFLLSELDRAEEQGALAVVLQVDSLASVVDEGVYLELATRLSETPVTIAFWVGPSGSAAEGGTAELAGVVDIVGVAGGSRIGATGPARLPDRFGPAFGDATARLADQAIGAQEAIDLGISVGPLVEVSTLPTFLLEIEGYELVRNEAGDQVSNVTQDFLKLPITSQLFHTVASPEITYLFFTGGLALLIFELYTAGVGIAGLVGMGMVVAGTYGLATLPFRTVGVVLLVLSFLALAVDIQTNLPRAYTVIGLVLFVAGTFVLWDGITMSWVTGMVGIVGAVLYAYIGMPTMVRTRFSSPVIGRKWLVGTDGQALTELRPKLAGEVRLGGAKWIATSGSGVIAAGEHVTVIATEGVELVVESSSKG